MSAAFSRFNDIQQNMFTVLCFPYLMLNANEVPWMLRARYPNPNPSIGVARTILFDIVSLSQGCTRQLSHCPVQCSSDIEEHQIWTMQLLMGNALFVQLDLHLHQ